MSPARLEPDRLYRTLTAIADRRGDVTVTAGGLAMYEGVTVRALRTALANLERAGRVTITAARRDALILHVDRAGRDNGADADD